VNKNRVKTNCNYRSVNESRFMRDLETEDSRIMVYGLLMRARDVLYANRDKELHQYGISLAEASVIYIIHQADNNITPAEISRKSYRKDHSIHGLLSRMEKKGLISRTRDSKRKNVWRVGLTDKGYQAYLQAVERKSIIDVTSILKKKELEQLDTTLRKLINKALES
jgi:MarR family transcriptional regulator, organic hydroperoxide resistance regulator